MTGTGLRRATVFSADMRPPWERMAGWRPREISCTSLKAFAESFGRPAEPCLDLVGLARHQCLGLAQFEAERHEALLDAVMQVAFEAAAGLIGGEERSYATC